MKKSVSTYALSVVALVACSVWQPATTRAADVTLTSGSAVLNCTFQVSDPSLLFTRIELTGQDFSLLFSSLPRPFPECSPAGISLNPARFDAFAVVTFQGITTMGMSGNLTFDETSITGLVEGRDLFNPNVVLFTVNFQGAGTGVITTTRSTFNVGAVPEPTTILLFGSGIATFLGARRFRRNACRKVRAQTQDG